MASSLTLGLWNSNQLKRIPLENVDLEDKVEKVLSEVVKKLDGNGEIELSYCGLVMENENTLSSYGVTPGVMIYALEKQKPAAEVKRKKYSYEHKVHPSKIYRTLVQKLSRGDIVHEIEEAIPEIKKDPVAQGIIQDPDLLILFANTQYKKKVAETNPILYEAVCYIFQQIAEDSGSHSHQPSTSTGYSYSLDALSDDEDLDSDNNMDSHSLTRNPSFNIISAAQLASAIASATNPPGAPIASTTSPSVNPSNSVITNEMFSNAMLEAFFNNGQPAAQPPAAGLQPQLQQMHELGLVNDAVNIRALQITGGDVQAAIEMVFNGTVE